jgi:hypothetical protein
MSELRKAAIGFFIGASALCAAANHDLIKPEFATADGIMLGGLIIASIFVALFGGSR